MSSVKDKRTRQQEPWTQDATQSCEKEVKEELYTGDNSNQIPVSQMERSFASVGIVLCLQLLVGHCLETCVLSNSTWLTQKTEAGHFRSQLEYWGTTTLLERCFLSTAVSVLRVSQG